MSHTTQIRSVPIKNIAALQRAVQALKAKGVNCDLVQNTRPRMYFREQEVVCDHVLKLHDGKYDVGFEKQKDGSYLPIYDEYRNYVGAHLSNKACPLPTTAEDRAIHQIGMLTQEYAKFAAIDAATQQGYYVESETQDEKGNYQLVFAN